MDVDITPEEYTSLKKGLNMTASEKEYIEEQLQQQENKYYVILISMINRAGYSAEQQKRIDDELELIHLSGSSKQLCMAYLIAKKLKEDNQCFSARGTMGNSLICYLLGITKFSPFDPQFKYVLPYQLFLGIKESPKKVNVTINVPYGYTGILLKMLQEAMIEDTEFYDTVDDNGKRLPFNLAWSYKGFAKTTVFKQNSPCSENEDYYIGCSKLRNYVESFDLPESYPCTISSELRKWDGSYIDREIGFKKLNEYLDDDYLFTNYKNKMAGKGNYWEYCLGNAAKHNVYDETAERLMICREDVWEELKKLNADESTRYHFFEQIRNGRAREFTREQEALFESAGETECLNKIKGYLYIFPVAHAIEEVETAIEIAWHKYIMRQEDGIYEKVIYTTEKSIEAKQKIETVAQYYGYSYNQLIGKNRSKPVSKARNMAMYICHECLGISFSFIGELFGNRDITTVIHGWAAIKDLLQKDDDIIRNDINSIIEQLHIEQ